MRARPSKWTGFSLIHYGRTQSEYASISIMARRGEFEKILTREDLQEMARRMAMLSEHSLREIYQRAHRDCAIINSQTFPAARSIQELVQAWKQLRKWRR